MASKLVALTILCFCVGAVGGIIVAQDTLDYLARSMVEHSAEHEHIERTLWPECFNDFEVWDPIKCWDEGPDHLRRQWPSD